ncbi:MAG TPA: metal-dependent hydrolase [Bacteroidia bacterium]|nr:metal-dependent hydrolase [Bacteroidia bacterium]
MDTLTHTVLGACLGEVIAGKQMGKKAMLIGALANNFPDVDVLSHFFTSPAAGLLAHRGITHSILCCTLLTVFFGWWLRKVFKNPAINAQRAYLLVGSGLFLHILMDACTSYGTGWFEPFSDYRVSFNTLFIIDPIFLLPLLIASIVLLILKKTAGKRQTIATTALTLSAFYLSITFFIKIYVNNIVNKDLATQNIPHSDYMVAPTPLNNLLWNVVTKNEKECYVGYYSVFDRRGAIDYEIIPKNDTFLVPVATLTEVQILKRFSKNYYSITKSDSSLVFNDIRFGQVGGWYRPHAPFVFKFDIIHKNNAAHIQQGRMESVGSKPIQALVQRIKGK